MVQEQPDAITELLEGVRGRQDTTEEALGRGLGNFIQGASQIPAGATQFLGIIEQKAGEGLRALSKESDMLDFLDPLGEDLEMRGDMLKRAGAEISKAAVELMDAPESQAQGGLGGFLSQDVAQGAGSMVPLLAFGGAPLLGALASASSMGAQEFLEQEARDPENEARQWQAMLGGMALGATEMVPVSRMLTRINQRSGGQLKKVLVDRIIDGGEEAAQEAFQTFGSNAIAKFIGEEDRDLAEGVLRAGAAGGVVALLTGIAGSGVNTALGQRDASTEQQVPFDAPVDTSTADTPLEFGDDLRPVDTSPVDPQGGQQPAEAEVSAPAGPEVPGAELGETVDGSQEIPQGFREVEPEGVPFTPEPDISDGTELVGPEPDVLEPVRKAGLLDPLDAATVESETEAPGTAEGPAQAEDPVAVSVPSQQAGPGLDGDSGPATSPQEEVESPQVEVEERAAQRFEATQQRAVEQTIGEEAASSDPFDLAAQLEAFPEATPSAQRDANAAALPEQSLDPASAEAIELHAFAPDFGTDIKNGLDALKDRLVRTPSETVDGILPTETNTERRIRKYVDELRPVKKLSEFIRKMGGNITDETDPELAERLKRGKAKAKLEGLRRERFKPLLTTLRKGKVSAQEYGEYRMALHAEERNRVIRARTAELEGGPNESGSGLTDQEAQEILRRVETSGKAEAFKDADAIYDDIHKQVRQMWLESGLKSQEEITALEEMYEHYTPLRSDLDEAGDMYGRPRGASGDARGKEFKGATGRFDRAKAENILGYTIQQAEEAVLRAENAKAKGTFVSLMRANPAMFEGVAKINPARTHRVLENGMVKERLDRSFQLADNVVVAKENGETVWIEFEPEYQPIATALRRLNSGDVGKLLQYHGNVGRMLSGLITRYNPVFPPVNAARDIQSVFGLSQEHGMRFALRTVANIPRAWGVLAKQKFGSGDPGGRYGQHLKDFQEEGGEIAFLDLDNFEDQLKKIDADMKADIKQGAIGQARRGWRSLLEFVESMNDVVENGTRLAAYGTARDSLGMSKKRASLWAKEISTNFEQKGEVGSAINAWQMFANAGIQGTARMASGMKHKGVQRFLISSVIGVAAWDQLMRLLGGEDDDGQNHYDKIPSYTKESNWIIMTPWRGPGEHYTIPAPWGWSAFKTMGEQLGAMYSGVRTPGQAAASIVSSSMNSFNPMGGSFEPDSAGVARSLAPTLAEPFIDLAVNRDFAGRSISPEAYWDKNKPNSQRFWPDASKVSRSVTAWLNSATGGDEFEAGSLDISPETLDHLGKSFMPGLGATIGRMIDLNEKAEDPEETITLEDIPLLRRFVGSPSQYASGRDFKDLGAQIKAEEDRLEKADKDVPRKLVILMAKRRRLDKERRRQMKEIDELKGEKKQKALGVLDRELKLFNKEMREFLRERDRD